MIQLHELERNSCPLFKFSLTYLGIALIEQGMKDRITVNNYGNNQIGLCPLKLMEFTMKSCYYFILTNFKKFLIR